MSENLTQLYDSETTPFPVELGSKTSPVGPFSRGPFDQDRSTATASYRSTSRGSTRSQVYSSTRSALCRPISLVRSGASTSAPSERGKWVDTTPNASRSTPGSGCFLDWSTCTKPSRSSGPDRRGPLRTDRPETSCSRVRRERGSSRYRRVE